MSEWIGGHIDSDELILQEARKRIYYELQNMHLNPASSRERDIVEAAARVLASYHKSVTAISRYEPEPYIKILGTQISFVDKDGRETPVTTTQGSILVKP